MGTDDEQDSWVPPIQRHAMGIRRRVIEMAARSKGGYVIQALGAAELLATLYGRAMHLAPSRGPCVAAPFPGVPRTGASSLWGGLYNGADAEHDRFVMSPAHYAAALYATLVEFDRLSAGALMDYNVDDATVEMIGAEHSPGFEATTGSLGQGLSVAIGRALARKRAGRLGRIWVFLSDGEFQEGQTWEAIQAGSAFGLDNLTAVVDRNGIQVDGAMELVMDIGAIATKVAAFGWAVQEVDGHDVRALDRALAARPRTGPYLVVSHSTPWHGVPSLQARYPRRLHYIRFEQHEGELALAEINQAAAAQAS